MSERADWGAVLDAVVSKILWSDDLHFLDRLRCQEVCQAWKSLLRERPGALPYTDLSTELCINLREVNNGQHIAPRLAKDPPAFHVFHFGRPWSDLAAPAAVTVPIVPIVPYHKAVSTFENDVFTCCRWLTLQAHLIRKIQLSGRVPALPHWSLVRLLVRSLQVVPPQTPPAIAIMVPLGPDFLCNCQELLINTLVALHFESMDPGGI